MDPASLLQRGGDTFTSQGLFLPSPCTEGMRWFVMTEALTLSTEQVVAYVDRFGKTAHPVQPTNGRKVEHYIHSPVVGGKGVHRRVEVGREPLVLGLYCDPWCSWTSDHELDNSRTASASLSMRSLGRVSIPDAS